MTVGSVSSIVVLVLVLARVGLSIWHGVKKGVPCSCGEKCKGGCGCGCSHR